MLAFVVKTPSKKLFAISKHPLITKSYIEKILYKEEKA
ncbi:hypothetical protein GP5015_2057 [gamma proteobacterium HTCC5015]|nr:hypothetical protein GP5015_2057 [gamma proteobacterium HTCC5015]